jgi:hypothetical protein
MIGPGIARALLDDREAEIARRAPPPWTREPGLVGDVLPAFSVVAGILLAAAIGSPMVP